VEGKGKIYAAPTMIVHYIESHSYLPPGEFIDAILADPFIDNQPRLITPRQSARSSPQLWDDLTPIQIADFYKKPTIMEDERWHTKFIQHSIDDIREQAKWGHKLCKQLLELLSDPQYDKADAGR
jgi:hypothetical protein